MALQRQDAQSAITPKAPVEQSGGAALAQVDHQIAGIAREEGQGWSQVATIGTGLMRDQALRQAHDDAAQIVQYDEKGQLIAPKSFRPSGLGGLVYSQTYTDAAKAYYKEAAIGEARNFAAGLVAKTPMDPDAVQKGMADYSRAKVEAMPEDIRDQMSLHFEGVRSGAVTSVSANRDRENLAVLQAQADASSSNWVDEYGAAKRGMTASTPPEQRAQTEKMFADRWNNVAALLKQSGHSDVFIAKAKAENTDLANGTAKGMELMERAQGMSLNPTGLDALKKEGFKWAHDPKNSGAIPSYKMEELLNGYIGRGAATAAAVEQASNIGASQAIAGLDMRVQALNYKLQTGAKNPDGSAVMTPDLLKEQQGIYSDMLKQSQGMQPVHQAQMMRTAGAAVGVVQHAYGAALTSAVTGADAAKTPEARALYEGQIKSFMADPYVIAASTSSPQMAALYAQGSRTLIKSDVAAAAGDAATAMTRLGATDGISPDAFRALTDTIKSTGLLGPSSANPIHEEQWATSGAAAMARWQGKQASATLAVGAIAASHGEDGQRPRLMTEAEGKAIDTSYPLAPLLATKNIDGTMKSHSLDFSNPEHQQVLSNYTARTGGHIPPEALQAFADLKTYDDPKAWQAASNYFDTARKTYRDTLSKSATDVNAPDGKPSADFLDRRSYDELRSKMGDAPYARAMQWDRTGIATNPGDIAKGVEGTTPGRNDGGPGLKEQSVAFLTGRTVDAVQNGGVLNSLASSAFRSAVGSFLNIDDKLAFKAWSNKETRAMLYQGIERSGLKGVSYDDSKVTMDPALADALSDRVVQMTGQNGEMLRKSGVANPVESNSAVALKMMMDNGTIGFEKTANGGLNLAMRPVTSEFNRLQGTNWTQPQVENLATSMARNLNPQLFDMTDEGTRRVVSSQMPDGSSKYYVVGRDKESGNPIVVGGFDPASSDLGRVRLDMAKMIDKEIGSSIFQPLTEIPLGGGSLLKSMMEGNKKDNILELAAGKTLPSAAWASVIRDIRDKSPGAMSRDAWEKLETMKMQETIARYGSAYALLFGNSGTADLAKMYRTPSTLSGPVPPVNPTDPALDDHAAVTQAAESVDASTAREAIDNSVAAKAARKRNK